MTDSHPPTDETNDVLDWYKSRIDWYKSRVKTLELALTRLLDGHAGEGSISYAQAKKEARSAMKGSRHAE